MASSSKRTNNHEVDDRVRLARNQYIHVFNKAREETRAYTWKRIKYNQCWYTDFICDNNTHYIILKSYNTVVAVYNVSKNKLVEYSKYSTTTSQHVCKFAREMMEIYHIKRSPERINLGLESVRE